MLPLSITMGLVAYGLIAKWYVLPALKSIELADALTLLILPHLFRYVGLAFLIPGVTDVPLDPRFSNPAAYGDLVAALLAFVAIGALRAKSRWAIHATWIFNIFGLLDLMTAVSLGIRFTEDGTLGATYFIPALIVPGLVVTHVMIFGLLRQQSEKSNAEFIQQR